MELREFVGLVIKELEGIVPVGDAIHFTVRVYGGEDKEGRKYADLITHSAQDNVIQFSCIQQEPVSVEARAHQHSIGFWIR